MGRTLQLAIAAFVFLAVQHRSRAAENNCVIATRGDSPVARACVEGGIDLARRKMRELVGVARSRGVKIGCDDCHQEEGNALTRNAAEDFKKLIAVNRPPVDRPVKSRVQ
jgi:hypothetical protein